MSFKDLKISVLLSCGFGALTLMIGLVGGVALWKAQAMNGDVAFIMESRFPVFVDVNDVLEEANLQARQVRNMLLMTDPKDVAKEREGIIASRSKVDAIYTRLDKSVVSPKGREVLAEMHTLRTQWRAGVDGFFKLMDDGKKPEATQSLFAVVRPVQLKYFDALQRMTETQTAVMREAGQHAEDSAANIKTTVATMLCIALIAAVTLAMWTIRVITRPIAQALAISQAVAAGDLSLQFEAGGKNETAQLLIALKTMQTNLSSVVHGVRQNAESVATASAQIAQGNTDLSQRTEQQASALEETAASMEQLGATVKHNADNARQANQLAVSARTVAEQGGDVVARVVSTMKEINDSSKRIADIIGTIDGIAFQTNILALNAAVEAARAGEQGRGFAVVASEVRSLAGRSAEAAKEIRALIGASVARVEQGSALVGQAGSTMTEVVDSIKRVTDIMGEISAASTEQSSGVAQVGEAVTQMDQATQQNAALVEESAAAAESLKQQAEGLVLAVAVFKLASMRAAALPAASARVERRSPTRAKNVTRPVFGKPPVARAAPSKPAMPPAKTESSVAALAPARAPAPTAAAPRTGTGTDDWESF